MLVGNDAATALAEHFGPRFAPNPKGGRVRATTVPCHCATPAAQEREAYGCAECAREAFLRHS